MSRQSEANSINFLGPSGPGSSDSAATEHHINPFDLLGQTEAHHICVLLPGAVEPQLKIRWNSFHQNFLSGIPAFFRWERVKENGPVVVFRDCRVESRFPKRAVTAAFLFYVAALVFPWPDIPAASRHQSAFENSELTWSGPIDDLPLIHTSRALKTSAAKAAEKPAAGQNDEAFHPRQKIYTDAAHPTHPRQTLVNSAAPAVAPQVVPQMPNIVELAGPTAPARPHIEISEKTLQKLHPRNRAKTAATPDAPAPDLLKAQPQTSDMNIVASTDGPARPQLQINAGAAPRMAERKNADQVEAAPDVAATSGTGASSTLIALSATPGPAAPAIPQGNLSARVAISPEGKPGAAGNSGAAAGGDAAGGAANGGTGKSPVSINISGGTPKANAGLSGLGNSNRIALPPRSSSMPKPSDDAASDPPARNGPPDFATLPPGAQPEQIFNARRIYTMNINMPNLNSVTGSWIIHFAELRTPGAFRRSGELSSPLVMSKIDPKYPPTLVDERVEGEVILYAVIRHDGHVDTIHLVRSVDPELDANARAAFAEWKFQPAMKDGEAVDVEAIVHIPFRAPDRRRQ